MAYEFLEKAQTKRAEARHVRQIAKEACGGADRERLLHQAEELESEAAKLERMVRPR